MPASTATPPSWAKTPSGSKSGTQGAKPSPGRRVSVNYYMPPMPGMVPMNYTIPAAPDGSGYTAKMNFIMTGPWNIVIRVESGGSPWRVTFPIDVR